MPKAICTVLHSNQNWLTSRISDNAVIRMKVGTPEHENMSQLDLFRKFEGKKQLNKNWGHVSNASQLRKTNSMQCQSCESIAALGCVSMKPKIIEKKSALTHQNRKSWKPVSNRKFFVNQMAHDIREREIVFEKHCMVDKKLLGALRSSFRASKRLQFDWLASCTANKSFSKARIFSWFFTKHKTLSSNMKNATKLFAKLTSCSNNISLCLKMVGIVKKRC